MPTPDDSELNQEQHDRIRSRAFSRGATLRRRRTLVRRSATVAAVLAIVGGGIAATQLTQGPGHGSRPVTPASGPTGPTGPTPTTVPGTGVTGNNGNTGVTGVTGTITSTSTTTTIVGGETTTTSSTPPDTTTTLPVLPPTTTSIPQTPYSNSLETAATAGTLDTSSWTDPADMTLAMSGFTVSDAGGKTSGAVRVQLLTQGQDPETLAAEGIDQIAANSLQVSLQTPVILLPGQQLSLTVSCDSNQPACDVRLDYSGTMWGTANLSTPDQSGVSENIAAPGTKTMSQWAVPSGETFSLTDLVLDSIEGATSATISIDIVNATTYAEVQNLYSTTLAKLNQMYVEEQLSPAVAVPAGDAIQVGVNCGADQPACQVDLLISGTSSNPSNPPGTTTTPTTSTTTTIPFGG